MVKELNPIKIEDLADYYFPGNLLYSPDGKKLAFFAKRSDLDKNKYHSDVYVVCGEETKQVTYSLDATFVNWDDNDTLVLRRSAEDALPGTTSLYKLNLNGGEAMPWVTLPFAMGSLKKVSDGLYVATGHIDAKDADAYLDTDAVRKEKAEAKKKDADYTVVDEVPYWFNGAGFTNQRRTALFLVKTEPALEVKRLTGETFNTGTVCVDGTKVYFTGNDKGRNSVRTSKIFCLDTTTCEIETVYGLEDHKVGEMFVLDGQLFAMASDMKKYGTNQTNDVCKVSKDSLEIVYTPEVGLHNTVIGDSIHGAGDQNTAFDNKFITIATVVDHNAIYEFNSKFEKKTVFERSGMVDAITVSEDKIAVLFQDWNNVAEVYTMNRDGSDFKQVSHLNDKALEGKYIAEPIELTYQSEGYDLNGWVLLPQNFDSAKKYPAVLDIHGGPRTAYGTTFFHEMQVWASLGYVVFFTNIKGSDGRGDAFADIRNDYGGTDFRNLMDFTDAVLAKYPNIDTTKICETGGSYGGFMSNWIIGHTDRFCAVASQRSISNWMSFSLIADIGNYFGPDQNGCDGVFGPENVEKMWNHSPLKYAENAKTPTLFIHSDEDYRCPLPEGMQMMQALAYQNVETRMCIFHGENHELSRSGLPQHRVRRLREITDWFEQHTK